MPPLLDWDTTLLPTVESCAVSLAETIPLVMGFIHRELRRHLDLNISVPQLRSLSFLQKYPGTSASELADYLGVTRATASALIERLVQRQLITRIDDPQSRRRLRLTLTDSGSQQLEQGRAISRKLLAEALQGLAPVQLANLQEGLRQLQEAFAQVPQPTEEYHDGNHE